MPVTLALAAIALAIILPHAGPILPRTNPDGTTTSTPGLLWLYLGISVAALVSGMIFVVYEAIATARYGRTLGKAWMHIRPIRTDGRALGMGQSFGRSAVNYLAGFVPYAGLLDPLWCLWDRDSQCVHDKIVNTLVISDT